MKVFLLLLTVVMFISAVGGCNNPQPKITNKYWDRKRQCWKKDAFAYNEGENGGERVNCCNGGKTGKIVLDGAHNSRSLPETAMRYMGPGYLRLNAKCP